MVAGETPPYQIVTDWIESLILSGELKVGDILPNERDLSTQLGVSRTVVREAIRALSAQGVLTSTVGKMGGTRVSNDQTGALSRVLRLQVALAEFPVSDVTEVRIALEQTSAAAAIEALSKVSPELRERTLKPMMDLLHDMEERVEIPLFNSIDTKFHIAIAKLGENKLVLDLTAAVRESLAAPILHSEHLLDDWLGFHSMLCRGHSAIAHAICNLDLPTAKIEIENHIREAYAILSHDPQFSPSKSDTHSG